MNRRYLPVLLLLVLLAACNNSGYNQGHDYADQLFAEQQITITDPHQAQQTIISQATASENYPEFVNGFCDCMQVLMWNEIERVNKKVGNDIFTEAQMGKIYDEMRAQLLAAEPESLE